MNDPTKRYREVQVQTSGKDDLLLLLVDGGVRFSEAGLHELEKGEDEDRTRRNEQLQRAQKIVLELMGSLSPQIGADLFKNLQALYRFTFERLFEGNVRSDVTLVTEAVTVFRQIQEMWHEAVAQARKEAGAAKTNAPPKSTSGLSITG